MHARRWMIAASLALFSLAACTQKVIVVMPDDPKYAEYRKDAEGKAPAPAKVDP